jgi:hypothetical protein
MGDKDDKTKVSTKAAPSFYYYAMFDGTSEVDSVAFGKDLDAKAGVTNWRNLLDLLDKDSKDTARLVDPKHPFLAIYKLNASAAKDPSGVAVVCAAGLGSKGKDDMWQGYGGAAGVKFPELTGWSRETLFGRHAAAEESARFMESFFIDPTVAVDTAAGTKQIVSGEPDAKGTLFKASLLYVSSHGWLGGFSRGNEILEFPNALPTPPAGAKDDPTTTYVPVYPYFAIGKLDASGKAFSGPEWIVLAQCSTANVNTWPMWARVMARSSPQVRGILGYEEASPDAGSAISIADGFFRHLKAGKSFYDAWLAANAGQNWAAIVHTDAMKDTLAGWPSKPPLVGASISDYLGSASKAPKQVKIDDPSPPFTIRVFYPQGAGDTEITPANLDSAWAMLTATDDYRVEIEIGAGKTISQVKIEWIHIRDTFKQVNRAKVFPTIVEAEKTAKVSLKDAKVVVVDYPTPVQTAKVTFTAGTEADLEASGMEMDHSYLWPRVIVTGTGLTDEKVDMKVRGINYLG